MTSPVAVVTGATRGIGKWTAVALAASGYDVVVTGRTVRTGDAGPLPGSLEETVSAIEAAGQRAIPVVLDLLDGSGLVPAAEACLDAFDGRVDVLLNNAIYVSEGGPERFLDTSPEEIEKRLFANVAAQLIFTQPILRAMVERGSGLIANMTSAAGYVPPPGPPGEGGWALTYGVSKAGFHRIVKQLVVEHPELRFLNLQPGFVSTERVLAEESLAFVASQGAPVDAVGSAAARILAGAAGEFENGSTVQVQDHL